jgi:hypothetical protein
MVYISNEQLKHLPYGPLTREVFENLSNSFYDASRVTAHQIASERGVRSGEALRLSFAEKLAIRGVHSAVHSAPENNDIER